MFRWNIDANDEEHPFIKNSILSKMDVARILIPKYDYYGEKCKNNNVNWHCLDNFMFRLLPFLSEIFVRDEIYRTPAYPVHQTSLCLLKVFPRCAKWAHYQRENLTKKAEGLKLEAMDRQDRDTQELFWSMLNEARHMSNR